MCTALVVLSMFVSATEELPLAEVKPHNGAPTLFINGEPQAGMSYMTYHPDAVNFKAFGTAGVHLYSFSATPTDSTYNLAPTCWVGPEEFDYSNMDERAHLVLDNDPDAYFFPRLYLGTPAWWADANPTELVTFCGEDGKIETFEQSGKRVASWASETWRDDTLDALRRFIAHVEQSDYASRVIGYHLASGTTEEWMQWGSNDDKWGDYSPINLARFRVWLIEKYKTPDALCKAWGNPKLTFLKAAIPTRAERAQGDLGYLRDPAKAQPCIDYALYTSRLTADTIRVFAHGVKEAVNYQRLVGVFYGYVRQLAGEQREQNSGHLALEEVFSCPDVDFITSPVSYASREPGTGYPHGMSLTESVKLHGKLWIDENDLRTWLTPGVNVGQYGKTGTYEETLLSQQREFAWVLTNRLGMWWFDMGGGWYDDPRIIEDISHMNRIANECRDVSGASVAEVAFVVDGKSAAYLRPGNPFTSAALIGQVPLLGRLGAPFATVLLADLDTLPPYKLYIFPNCLAPTAEERKLIAEKVQACGAAVVWMGPAGLYRDGRMDPAAMTELTGVPLTLTESKSELRIAPVPETAAEWGWDNAVTFGPDRKSGVLALPAPETGVTLGLIDSPAVPGLIAQEKDGALTVFTSAPLLPPSLLRAIAKKAGVHLYIDTEDIVWATHDLVSLSVNQAGPRTLHLPRPCRVTNLWAGETIAENTDSVTVDIPEKATVLLRLSSE